MLNSKLPVWTTVAQSAACHPDWSPADHVAYLDAEWWQTDDWRSGLRPERLGLDSAEALVEWWLTLPADDPRSIPGYLSRIGVSR